MDSLQDINIDQISNNKRIAKNTALLYIRMLVMMVVSLYTSRVVLSSLGVVDFGLYNVVGGIVLMLGFLNGTMSTASSRFITVALGRGNKDEMISVFNTTLLVNAIFALIVVLIAETVGFWFLFEKMQIPSDRMDAAIFVYQLSVFTVVVNILSVAYNASIIAHEKMKAFAFIGLFDAFCKLGIAFVISSNVQTDRLILYASLMFSIQIVDQFIYWIYCNKNLDETKFKLVIKKKLIQEQYSFIGWSSYGSFVSAASTQGLNILLNLFFGPAVNAARGVSFQVQNAVTQFTQNFQTAINPQIIKSVANNDLENSKSLLIASSKYSFFLLCLLGVPVIGETHFLLNVWLKDIPSNTVLFVQLMVTISIFSSLANPLRTINQAEGNIKKFQLYECSVLLLIVPLSYFCLLFLKKPEMVFIINLIIELIAQVVRILIVLPKIKMTISKYTRDILIKIIPLYFIPLLIGILISNIFEESVLRFLCNVIIIASTVIIMTFFFCVTKYEKSAIYYFINNKILKR